ncbi:sensor histidine kinase [Streptomyces sp. NPDC051104]|uniref:sensor histidine kinase n=1 Tax=Streptomyces sp. NPDC051104 TaxID=3155044 RepID=UPI0034169DC2
MDRQRRGRSAARAVALPAGAGLDLGATAKALCADRAVARAARAAGPSRFRRYGYAGAASAVQTFPPAESARGRRGGRRHRFRPVAGRRRERPTQSSGRTGTGLGLAIVRAFVECHGGGLTVVSERPGDSLLRTQLPLHPPAAEPRS